MRDKPLVIEHLCHSYGNQPVLNDINIELQPGEFLSILGCSGSGKTTLLRTITGLIKPDSGKMMIADLKVLDNGREKVPTEKRQVGFVFQDYALFPHLTVYDNIAFGLKLNKKDCHARVMELLTLTGMQAFARRRPEELSGGQQQRVAIARALAPHPRLLLLDEPFANVDANLRQALGEELQILVRNQGVSVILVTHDRNEALALADRVMIIDASHGAGSSIAQTGTPEMVYHRPVTQAVAALTGPVSFMPATAYGDAADTAFGTLNLLINTQGEGYIMLRPEMASFTECAQGDVRVIARLFQGHAYRLLCQTQHGNIFALSQSPPDLGACGTIKIMDPCWFLTGKTGKESLICE